MKGNNIIGEIVSANVYWNDSGVRVKDRLEGMTEMQNQLLHVSAQGMGVRQVRTGKEFGEIYDHHAIELTYPNGVRVSSQCHHQKGCVNAT